MVIIFYDSDKEEVYIATDRDKMKIVPVDDPNLLSYIPNDDIMYVQNAHIITKKQFGDWMSGELEFEEEQEPHRYMGFMNDETDIAEPTVHKSKAYMQDKESANRKWIHPKHHGSIVISDLKTPNYPDGLVLKGKWDFIPLDELGELAEESRQFKGLVAKGKIEVVTTEYVKKNIHKAKQVSLADAALDRIILKDQTPGSAENIASSGGLDYSSQSDVIEIYVE